MATARQAFANQQNSQHSTGPKTPDGKAASSRNSLRHGLASGQLLIPGETPEEFEALYQIFADEYLPATTHETVLVQEITKYKWLADRAIRLQGEQLALHYPEVPGSLQILLRYQLANERLYQKTIEQLLTTRKAKAIQQNGFVPQSVGRTPSSAPDPLVRPSEPLKTPPSTQTVNSAATPPK
jgi:hypothetical protein